MAKAIVKGDSVVWRQDDPDRKMTIERHKRMIGEGPFPVADVEDERAIPLVVIQLPDGQTRRFIPELFEKEGG